MSARPSIPLDIIEVILDILASLDLWKFRRRVQSAHACALTCRSFLHFTRKHTFARAAINTARPDPPPPFLSTINRRFLNLLDTTPEIANYFRELTFGVPPPPPSNGDIFPELSRMLKKFTHIQELTVGSLAMGHNVWDIYLQDALFHLVELPTISYLKLMNLINFPFSALARCVHLKYLHIYYMKFSLDNFSPTSYDRSISLDKYSMDSSSRDATNIIYTTKWSNGQPVFDFQYLKKFSARDLNSTADMEMVRRILQKSDQLTIVRLDINQTVNFSNLAGMVSASLRSLRRIVLECRVNDSDDPLAGLAEQLKRMRESPNVLEELEFSVVLVDDGMHVTNTNSVDQWSRLDDALNDPRWSFLKIISLQIKKEGRYTQSAERKRILSGLSILSSRKDITFNCRFVNGHLFPNIAF